MRKRQRRAVSRQSVQGKIHTEPTDNMDSFNILMVLAFFLATFFIFQSFFSLDLSWIQLIQSYCLFAGISFLISIKWYRKKLTMSFYEYILFNLLTFAPTCLALLFFLNNIGKGNEYVETYAIEDFEQNEYRTIYTLKDRVYDDKEYLRALNQYDDVEIMGNQNLSIYFSDGLCGIRIIERKVLH